MHHAHTIRLSLTLLLTSTLGACFAAPEPPPQWVTADASASPVASPEDAGTRIVTGEDTTGTTGKPDADATEATPDVPLPDTTGPDPVPDADAPVPDTTTDADAADTTTDTVEQTPDVPEPCEYTKEPETQCDGLDENCDGKIDEGCDDDGDDYCDASMTTVDAPEKCPLGGGDCDDDNQEVHPGAEEVCNEVNDDCDGETDECDITDPSIESATCNEEGSCVPVPCPEGFWNASEAVEGCEYACTKSADDHPGCEDVAGDCDGTCNGLDNDCDGNIDEDFDDKDYCGVGACLNFIPATCEANGVLDTDGAACNPNPKSVEEEGSVDTAMTAWCNGVDDDCDGETDEEVCHKMSAEGPTTYNTCGSTAPDDFDCTYALNCEPGFINLDGLDANGCEYGCEVTGETESCDGIDNDCDGATDEEEDLNDAESDCLMAGVCAAEVSTSCVDGDWSCNYSGIDTYEQGSEQSCDGLDNDCDGETDEDFDLAGVLVGGVCPSEGACGAGVVECANTNGGTRCSTHPDGTAFTGDPAENNCNGVDDDCDGMTDEEYEAQESECGLGACKQEGVTSCVEGVEENSCEALDAATVTDHECDGVDDDCDGEIDEDYTAAPVICGVGACEEVGETICVNGTPTENCTPGTPAAQDANCDGVDDDCSGEADEDSTCDTHCIASVEMTVAGVAMQVHGCLEVRESDDASALDTATATCLGELESGVCPQVLGNDDGEADDLGQIAGCELIEDVSYHWFYAPLGDATGTAFESYGVPSASEIEVWCGDSLQKVTKQCETTPGCDPVTDPDCLEICTHGDGKSCTEVSCNTDEGVLEVCDYTLVHTVCDDGVECTDDVCEPDSDASESGTGCTRTANDGACDDGLGCTADTCDAVTGCSHVAQESTLCEDGDPCTENDACQPDNSCEGTPRDCTAVATSECKVGICTAAQGCKETNSVDGIDCDDGNACTVADSCDAGSCSPGSHIACAAGQTCNPETGGCESDSTDPDCVVDSDCDDRDPCTVDTCTGGGLCDHTVLNVPACTYNKSLCCAAKAEPGCGIDDVATCVCETNGHSECCDTAWTDECLQEAVEECEMACPFPICGDGACNGDEDPDACPEDCEDFTGGSDSPCCTASSEPGCAANISVQTCVCEAYPDCCSEPHGWTTGCVETAIGQCGLPCESGGACGNGSCDAGETSQTCGLDCFCGNGVCDFGETSDYPPDTPCSDCSCGDDVCDLYEDSTSCPTDCYCGDGRCEYNESNAEPGEPYCAPDCDSCGNGTCDESENSYDCDVDCTCGDGVCDEEEFVDVIYIYFEGPEPCWADCDDFGSPPVCGDGECAFEEEGFCELDCGLIGDMCGDMICGPGEEGSCGMDCPDCGDFTCGKWESDPDESEYCPEDCTNCSMGYCCPNDVCDPGEESGMYACAQDCFCGNEVCDEGEDNPGYAAMYCPEDCTTCGNDLCEFDEQFNCPGDCETSAGDVCGDDVCEGTETIYNCSDCGDIPANTCVEDDDCPNNAQCTVNTCRIFGDNEDYLACAEAQEDGPCDDDNACTLNDQCTSGECQGTLDQESLACAVCLNPQMTLTPGPSMATRAIGMGPSSYLPKGFVFALSDTSIRAYDIESNGVTLPMPSDEVVFDSYGERHELTETTTDMAVVSQDDTLYAYITSPHAGMQRLDVDGTIEDAGGYSDIDHAYKVAVRVNDGLVAVASEDGVALLRPDTGDGESSEMGADGFEMVTVLFSDFMTGDISEEIVAMAWQKQGLLILHEKDGPFAALIDITDNKPGPNTGGQGLNKDNQPGEYEELYFDTTSFMPEVMGYRGLAVGPEKFWVLVEHMGGSDGHYGLYGFTTHLAGLDPIGSYMFPEDVIPNAIALGECEDFVSYVDDNGNLSALSTMDMANYLATPVSVALGFEASTLETDGTCPLMAGEAKEWIAVGGAYGGAGLAQVSTSEDGSNSLEIAQVFGRIGEAKQVAVSEGRAYVADGMGVHVETSDGEVTYKSQLRVLDVTSSPAAISGKCHLSNAVADMDTGKTGHVYLVTAAADDAELVALAPGVDGCGCTNCSAITPLEEMRPFGLIAADTHLFVTGMGTTALRVYDTSDAPMNPTLLSSTPGYTLGVEELNVATVHEEWLFAAGFDSEFNKVVLGINRDKIIDGVVTTSSALTMPSVPTTETVLALEAGDGVIYALVGPPENNVDAGATAYIWTIDVSDPTNPQTHSFEEVGALAGDLNLPTTMRLSGGLLYISDPEYGIIVLDTTNDLSEEADAEFSVGLPFGIYDDGTTLYVASGEELLTTIEVSCQD